VSQSRRLPSWPPLARCTVVCEMNRCDMSAAYDRTDGRCYWHGKEADGLFGAHRSRDSRLNTCGKYPWTDWLDGNEHIVNPAASFQTFRFAAYGAAKRRGLAVTIWLAGDAIHLCARLAATRAA
jgi:hypothetical protein